MFEDMARAFVAYYHVPEFSHAETLVITGLSNKSIQNWYQRGYFDSVFNKTDPGRGNRRKYSLGELVCLRVTKAFVDLGIPVSVAVEFGSKFCPLHLQEEPITAEGEDLLPAEAQMFAKDLADPEHDSRVWGVIRHRVDGKYEEMVVDGHQLDTHGGLEQYILSFTREGAVVVPVGYLAQQIMAKAFETASKRPEAEEE